jgi:hypothetical protein
VAEVQQRATAGDVRTDAEGSMITYKLFGLLFGTAALLAAGLGGYSLLLRSELSHTRALLEYTSEQLQILVEDHARTQKALQSESASRARIERESREWRARLERTQDPDWLEWREQPLPKVLTERYGQ